jgi:hypothetical protein
MNLHKTLDTTLAFRNLLLGKRDDVFETNQNKHTEKLQLLTMSLDNLATTKKRKETKLRELPKALEAGLDGATFTKLLNATLHEINQLEIEIAEKRDELDLHRQVQDEQEFIWKFRNDQFVVLDLLADKVDALPHARKQELIAGMLGSKIIVLADDQLQIPWRFNLALLQAIIKGDTPPDGTGGSSGDPNLHDHLRPAGGRGTRRQHGQQGRYQLWRRAVDDRRQRHYSSGNAQRRQIRPHGRVSALGKSSRIHENDGAPLSRRPK